jgi:hypothetical protein
MNRIVRTHSRFIVSSLFIGMNLAVLLFTGTLPGSFALIAPEDDAYVIEPTAASMLNDNCRYGVSPLDSIAVPWVYQFGAGWYLNFQPTPPGLPPVNDAEFAHVIRTAQHQDGSGGYYSTYTITPPLTEGGLGALVDANPGALWLVGNEVDRGADPGELVGGQDHTYPELYATIYNKVYYFIKGRDPTARVAISALVQVTPNRLEYLDKVWDEYLKQFWSPIPVDVWNMHLYILPEVRPDGSPNGIANVALGTDASLGKRESNGNGNLCSLDSVYCFAEHDDINVFREQVVAMRSWMKAHGQQRKPLIISEYSLLYPYDDEGDNDPTTCFLRDEYGGCFTPTRVTNFMLNSFDYLNNLAKDPDLGYPLDDDRLVQQWMWFSVRFDGAGSASNLVENDFATMTMVGQAFQNHVLNEPSSANLLIDRVSYPISYTNGMTETTASLSVSFRNNGNRRVTTPITVTFYSDAAMQTPIGSSTITATVRGCATVAHTATTKWEGLAAGYYPYWVRIESQGNVNGVDNIGSGFVLIDPQQVYLPGLMRN